MIASPNLRNALQRRVEAVVAFFDRKPGFAVIVVQRSKALLS